MAAKPVAAFFADSHLQDRAWAGRDVAGDAYCSFRQIIQWSIDHEVKAVVGAGDLLDKVTNRAKPIVFLNQQMDRLVNAKIAFMHVQGQHEADDSPWFNSHHWVEHANGMEFSMAGLKFFGLDYLPSPQLQIALNAIPPGTDVLVAHQTWRTWMGEIASPQGDFSDIPHVSVVFSGDYHVNKVTEAYGKGGQKLMAISPGSTCLQSIEEDPVKWFYVLCDDQSWKKVRLQTRYRADVTMSTEAELVAFLQGTDGGYQRIMDGTVGHEEVIRKPILRVIYAYGMDGIRQRISSAVADRFHLFWKELPPPPAPEVVIRRKTAAEKGEKRAATLLSELPAYLEQQEMTDLQDDCVRLLQTGDPAGELLHMKDEVMRDGQS